MERERNAQINVLVTVPFSEAEVQALRDVSPRLKIDFHAAREPGEISKEHWNRAEVLYTDQVLPAPELVHNLRWLQFHWAGLDFALENQLILKPDLMVTSLSGAAA